MKHLEKFLKLIVIGVLTALVRTYVQGFIPVPTEADMWQSIFAQGGIVQVAYFAFGSIFYTFMAALFLMFYKKIKGNRLLKGLKFSLLLLMIWVPFLWEPLPHITLMDKVYYSFADAAALLFMGVLAGVFVVEGKKAGKVKGKPVKNKTLAEAVKPMVIKEGSSKGSNNTLNKPLKEEVDIKEVVTTNPNEDAIKTATVSSANAGIKKGYPAKKQGSGKKASKGRKKSKSQKAAAKKKPAAARVETKPLQQGQKGSDKKQPVKNNINNSKPVKEIEKNVAADVAVVKNKKLSAKQKAALQKRNKFSVLNVLIIGLIFFLMRMGMYKFFRVYSFYGTNAGETMLWGLLTGLAIGVVYELICPLINTKTTHTRSIIFSAVFLALNLIAFNGFKSLVYSLDMADLIMRTIGDVAAVLLGGVFCVLFDMKK